MSLSRRCSWSAPSSWQKRSLTRFEPGDTAHMRIAHVTATFPPYWAGTGNVAYYHARTLTERGHDVTVFTATPHRGGSQRFPFAVEYLRAPFRLGNAPFTPHLVYRLRGFDLIHLHY